MAEEIVSNSEETSPSPVSERGRIQTAQVWSEADRESFINYRVANDFYYIGPTIYIYGVTEEQIEKISAGANGTYIGVAGITMGVATTALTTLVTVELSPMSSALFLAAFITTLVISVVMANLSYAGHRKARRVIDEIKAKRLGMTPEMIEACRITDSR